MRLNRTCRETSRTFDCIRRRLTVDMPRGIRAIPIARCCVNVRKGSIYMHWLLLWIGAFTSQKHTTHDDTMLSLRSMSACAAGTREHAAPINIWMEWTRAGYHNLARAFGVVNFSIQIADVVNFILVWRVAVAAAEKATAAKRQNTCSSTRNRATKTDRLFACRCGATI